MKSQKNGHGNAQIAKIFCDLYMGISVVTFVEFHNKEGEIQ